MRGLLKSAVGKICEGPQVKGRWFFPLATFLTFRVGLFLHQTRLSNSPTPTGCPRIQFNSNTTQR